jgi:VanZ family protein
LELGRAYRSDWVANVLLFALSAYLWIGSVWPGRRGAGAVLRSVAVWAASAGFVAALEFAQVYFPPRSVALQDVFAGSVGAALGIVAWWVSARRVVHLLGRWSAAPEREGLAGWLFWPYAVFLVVYDVMPLDLTSSPHALYEKWEAGRIWVIPFASLHGSLVERLHVLGTEALPWLPLAALWVLSGRASRLTAWSATVLVAIGVECVQLVVRSRVSDVTDVLSAAAGAALGAAAGGWLAARAPAALTPARGPRPADGAEVPLLALLGFFAWSVALGAALCHPFRLHVDPATFDARVDQLLGVPFRLYGSGPGRQGLLRFLGTLFLFAPPGALLAVVWARVRGPWARRACAVGSVGAVGVVAVLIESAQVFLPEKVPDSTDVLAGTLGGALGYAVLLAAWRRVARGMPERPGSARSFRSSPPT